MPGDDREFRTSQVSADHMRATIAATGVLVCGRRLFDLTRAWGGRHPAGVSVFVVTHRVPDNWAHPDAPFTSSPTG